MKYLTLAIVAFVGVPLAAAQDYDLGILNGRVMDPETMYDAIANVGIKNGRITAITKDKISGKATINAGGLVVAAKFVDTHLRVREVHRLLPSVPRQRPGTLRPG